MSSGGKTKPVSELSRNLKHVISWNANIQPENIVADFSKPIFIAECVLNDQKNAYKEMLLK